MKHVHWYWGRDEKKVRTIIEEELGPYAAYIHLDSELKVFDAYQGESNAIIYVKAYTNFENFERLATGKFLGELAKTWGEKVPCTWAATTLWIIAPAPPEMVFRRHKKKIQCINFDIHHVLSDSKKDVLAFVDHSSSC